MLAGFIVLILFAACSGNKGGAVSTGGAAETTGFTGTIGNTLQYDLSKPVNEGKPITIEFWTQNELQKIHEKLITEYTRIHPNVKVNLTPLAYADLFQQKLPIALQTGTGPDVFHMHNSYDAILRPYLAPYPQDILPIDAIKADFSQVDAHIVNGELCYIDMGLMTSGIFYNKVMWAEAGLTENDIPTTWEDFIRIAQKLTVADKNGSIIREGFSINGNENYILILLALQNGRFLFDESLNKPVVNDDVWKQSLRFVKDLYDVYKVSSIQHPPGVEAFANGQGAMAYQWGWYGSWLAGYPDLQWGFFVLPTMDGKTPPAYDRNNGEATFSISKKAAPKVQAAAFDLLKFFICSDNLLAEADLLLSIAPTKVSLVNHPDILANAVLGLQGPIIDRTIWPGPVPDPYFLTLTTYATQAAILNGIPIETALAEAQNMENRDFVAAFPDFRTAERQYAHSNELR
jgi:multiple sugar transport system substrate-binding protein